MGKWIAWICKDCEHIVVAEDKPQPINWTDGHTCHFIKKEMNLQTGEKVNYQKKVWRLDAIEPVGQTLYGHISNGKQKHRVNIAVLEAHNKKSKKKEETKKVETKKVEPKQEVQRTPFGSRIGTKAAKIEELLIADKKAGVKYDGYEDWEKFVERLGIAEPTVGCHIFNLNKYHADKLKELGIVPPDYRRRGLKKVEAKAPEKDFSGLDQNSHGTKEEPELTPELEAKGKGAKPGRAK
jgi:hypothetical protein